MIESSEMNKSIGHKSIDRTETVVETFHEQSFQTVRSFLWWEETPSLFFFDTKVLVRATLVQFLRTRVENLINSLFYWIYYQANGQKLPILNFVTLP